MQGVTSDVIGNCGFSPAPVSEDNMSEVKRSMELLSLDVEVEWSWSSFGDYLKALQEMRPSINLIPLVGHIPIRTGVIGFEDRAPSVRELEEMKRLLSKSLEDGAFGMSAGLMYPPSSYAGLSEMIALARVVKGYDRILTIHKRDLGDHALESVEEVLEIGKRSGVRLQVSHNSIKFKRNWDKMGRKLEMLEMAREGGVEVTADHYPYNAGCTYLAALLPDWAQVGGTDALLERIRDEDIREKVREDILKGRNRFRMEDLEDVVISKVEKNKDIEGMRLPDAARARDREPLDFLFDLLIDEDASVAILLFAQPVEGNREMIKHFTTMIGSDSVPANVSPHPRAWGTFPKVLGRFARDEGLMTLSEAIRKMTSFPAQTFRLKDRGIIRVGMNADLTIFNRQTVSDRSTYTNTTIPPVGIINVIVGGEIALKDGKPTGVRSGRVLKA